jgi:hypothetical protein
MHSKMRRHETVIYQREKERSKTEKRQPPRVFEQEIMQFKVDNISTDVQDEDHEQDDGKTRDKQWYTTPPQTSASWSLNQECPVTGEKSVALKTFQSPSSHDAQHQPSVRPLLIIAWLFALYMGGIGGENELLSFLGKSLPASQPWSVSTLIQLLPNSCLSASTFCR